MRDRYSAERRKDESQEWIEQRSDLRHWSGEYSAFFGPKHTCTLGLMAAIN
jgi:hypothetical protein